MVMNNIVETFIALIRCTVTEINELAKEQF